MEYVQTRIIEEIKLSNDLIVYVRTMRDTTKIRVDLSVYEYMVEVPELHLYSNTRNGSENFDGMLDIYAFLADEERIQKLWKQHKEAFKKEEKNK